MKRVVKWSLRLVIAVVIVLILAVAAVAIYCDEIAKYAVEREGTAALGVTTSVKAIDLSLVKGECHINSLSVANPSGYDTDHFMTLKSGLLDVAPLTLLQNQIVVPDLELTGIDLNLESKNGTANYQVIMNNMQSLQGNGAGAASGGTSGGASGGASGGGGGKKYKISRVVIKDVTVHADLLPLGGQATLTKIEIPEIDLPNGIGSDTPNGVVLAQLSGVITQAILKAVSDKVGNLLPGDMGKDLSAGLQGLGDLGGLGAQVVGDVTQNGVKVFSNVSPKVQEIGKELGTGLKALGKDLGGLFGKKKKEDDDQSSGN